MATSNLLKPYNTNQLIIDAAKLNPNLYNVNNNGNVINNTTTTNNSTSSDFIGPIYKPLELQDYVITSSGSGGMSRSYLSSMLSAYDQAADADRALAQQVYDTSVRNLNTALNRATDSYNRGVSDVNTSYDTTRNDLLTSLKRFQEDNARSVANQKRAYLSEQASLESARAQADRQTRIDAAARGLGGSGLQQLAQLQNLISQGQDISNLALSNQGVMEDLRTDLANYTEDINTDLANANKSKETALANLLATLTYAQEDNTTGLQDALTTYQNTINSINANLAQNKANANYSYAQSNAAASKQSESLVTYLTGLQKEVKDSVGALSTMSNSELKTLASELGFAKPNKVTKSDIANAYVEDALNSVYNLALEREVAPSYYNTLNSNLSSILKYYGY